MQMSKYLNKLRALGCEKIGSGLYSNVFAVPNTDKVIKVASGDRWPDYIHWATSNGYAGKFAPKVFSLKFYEDSDLRGGIFYVAVMERLVDTINGMKSENMFHNEQVSLLYGLTSWDNSTCEATDFVAFYNELRSAGLKNDLHGANVMVRKDGQLVITDPVSGEGSSRFRIKNAELA